VKDSIEVNVSHPKRRVAFLPIRTLIQIVVEGERVSLDAVSIVFADHETVQRLNRNHLGRSYTTDVIAFDLRETPGVGPIDGEIYVDLDTAAERAPEFGVRYTDEVWRYTVHGMLHLTGRRDDTDAGKEEMKRLEDRYLREHLARRNAIHIST
jgi:rRNA maturation RNase YbeY